MAVIIVSKSPNGITIKIYQTVSKIDISVGGHPPVDPKMNFDTELYHVLILLTQMMMQCHIPMLHVTKSMPCAVLPKVCLQAAPIC